MNNNNIQIFTSRNSPDEYSPKNCVLALGFFDGVHIAHRALIQDAKALAARLGAEAVGAWCFAQSPASFLGGKSIPLLCSREETVNRLLSLGLDFVAVGDFPSLCALSAEDFISQILRSSLSCIGVACGFNHHFGNQGKGNAELLKKVFGNDAVSVLSEVRVCSETVSSSAIRSHVLGGNPALAKMMLGRAYSITAEVVKGKALGRTIGFPTANMLFDKELLVPKYGIYAVRCTTEGGKRFAGVSNVGVRPTIVDGSDKHVPNCETYIHGFVGELYGKCLTVEFCEYLREEKRFSSIDALQDQIRRDLDAALAFFKYQDIEF